jgi:cell division control protein 11
VKRDAKALDTHIHSCLYFIDIQSINGLSEADRYILKNLSSRVNIVPVIGKSDTLTVAQRDQLKTVFRREIFDILQIPIYGYIEVDGDDDEIFGKRANTKGYRLSQRNKILNMLQECVEEDKDEDALAMIDYLQSMPFTLIGYEEDSQTGRPININNDIANKSENLQSEQVDEDEEMLESLTPVTRKKEFIKNKQMIKSVLGRSYPWAVVECCNPTHCDFQTLKNALLSGHTDMLRIDTFERFYEQYRTKQLLNRKVSKIRVESKQGMSLV